MVTKPHVQVEPVSVVVVAHDVQKRRLAALPLTVKLGNQRRLSPRPDNPMVYA
jgi:hypothetical protein